MTEVQNEYFISAFTKEEDASAGTSTEEDVEIVGKLRYLKC